MEKNRKKADISPELVAKAKAGDQAAFEELYRQTGAELYRSIRAMVHDEDTAWDIQQDTYLKAYQSLGKLSQNEAFLPWLRRIAVNITVSQMRKRLAIAFSDLSDEDDDVPDQPDLRIDTQPELALDQKETSRLVQQILAELPKTQHLVLGMRYYDDLSVNEIAELLHLSPNTIRVHLLRARKHVETSVRALEKQGVKLYGLTPVAFLMALMRRMEPAEAAQQSAIYAVMTKASGGAVAANAVPVTASTVGQTILHGLLGKVLVGVLSAAVVGGCIWAGSKLLDRNAPDAPLQPSDVTETAERTSDSLGNLTNSTDSESEETTESNGSLSGTCGEHLTWRFDPDSGMLTIEGSGAMDDFDDHELGISQPWHLYTEQITDVSFPEGLTSIGNSAFQYCNGLTWIQLPEAVKSIGASAFEGCKNLEYVRLPETMTSIGAAAFSECSKLDIQLIPEGITTIAHKMFWKCSGEQRIWLPESVTDIEADAFGFCTNLTRIQLPGGLRTIGDAAFRECSSLDVVLLPNGLEQIGSKAFRDCTALRQINLPQTLTTLGDDTFLDCTALKEIRFFSEQLSTDTMLGAPTDATIYGFSDSAAAAQYAQDHGYGFEAITASDSDTLRSMVEPNQDLIAAMEAAIGTGVSFDTYYTTWLIGIVPFGERQLAQVVQTKRVTITEEERNQAKQTGKLVLNGTEFRWTDSREQFEAWGGPPEDWMIGSAEGGWIVDEGGQRFYSVDRMGSAYAFNCSEPSYYTWLDEPVETAWVWLDSDFPVKSAANIPTLDAFCRQIIPDSGLQQWLEFVVNDAGELYLEGHFS